MYSVILMAAMTAGPAETPTWLFHHRSCHGCYGACYGCYGCCGGYASCRGCWGCYGGYAYSSCCGCCGGYAYGGGYGGCYGGYAYGGCTGSLCFGCVGVYPSYSYPAGMMTPPVTIPETTPKPKPADTTKSGTGTAKLIIEVPADATLYIDDQPMRSTASVRQFYTPRLEPGQAYYYMLRAERNGEKVGETQKVIVRAGETVRATFNDTRTPTVTLGSTLAATRVIGR